MTLASSLLPLAILMPLGMAAVLLGLAHWLPARLADGCAIVTALAVAALCGWLSHRALAGPVPHWFGGWTPAASGRPGVVLGIGFLADPASAGVASFCGLLFAASFVFAWGYFDDTHSHFHILMLMFLAAMVGFCLTHDLFNLFVWFELMSVAAFALTAYPLGGSQLEGAFNFTITNALASFMMLAGVGLLYARTGTLDFTAMAQAVTRIGSDPVLTGGFCLIAAALLTKAAILPFHLWLADAHAVAPSPVSVIFSGIMVSLALFGLAKIVDQIFADDRVVTGLVMALLRWLGIVSAVVAALMAWAQRHLKRLLAFSTIAHMGIMLVGLATLAPVGRAGLLLYILGHGLVKGALFMLAGILLALCASADEIALYGRARRIWPAGVVMALAALLLGGLPYGLLHEATDLIHDAAKNPVVDGAAILSTALTGAAVLRACLRAFFGWSGAPGVELMAPTERERERNDRPLWLMLLPCAMLLALDLIPPRLIAPLLGQWARHLADPTARGALALPASPLAPSSCAALAITLALVALSLVRERPVRKGARAAYAIERRPFALLGWLHSGLVGDYVVWMAIGLAAFAAASWAV